MYAEGLFFVFSRSIFAIRRFESFEVANGSILTVRHGRGRRILNPVCAQHLPETFVLRGANYPFSAERKKEGFIIAYLCEKTNTRHIVPGVYFLAGAGGFEPATHGFGDRYSTS